MSDKTLGSNFERDRFEGMRNEAFQESFSSACAAQSGVEQDRQPKHIEIVDAIDRYEVTLTNLKDLIDKVVGAPIDPEAKTQGIDVPSLSEVLNASPDKINKLNSRLDDYIQHLHDALF